MSWYVNKIKIPKKHYIGLMVQDQNPIPLGFMTPFGADKAYDKRKDTVDQWCIGYGRKPINSKIIDNKPMTGFKLTFDIRNGYRGSPDAWRILDPRGFELEIRSHNLAHLMATTTIKNGEFDGELIWARSGSNNVLLATDTEEYKEIAEINKVMDSVKHSYYSIKDIKPGYKIILENGTRCTYLGRYVEIHLSDNVNFSFDPKKKKHVFHISKENTTDKTNDVIFSRANVKVAEILDQTVEYTVKEAEKITNEYLFKEDIHKDCGYLLYAFTTKGLNVTLDSELVDTGHDVNWYKNNLKPNSVSYYSLYYVQYNNDFYMGRLKYPYAFNKIDPITLQPEIKFTKGSYSGKYRNEYIEISPKDFVGTEKVFLQQITFITDEKNKFVNKLND